MIMHLDFIMISLQLGKAQDLSFVEHFYEGVPAGFNQRLQRISSPADGGFKLSLKKKEFPQIHSPKTSKI